MSEIKTICVEIGKKPSVPVRIRLMKRVKTRNVIICPICRQPIEVDVDMYMIINNCKLFPNTFVHKKCTNCIAFDIVVYSADGWDEICNFLMEDYNKALKAKELYKCWFQFE